MRLLLTILLIAGFNFRGYANNIKVQNAAIVEIDEAEGTRTVVFDVSWSNSWRVNDEPKNHDAAWIFAKYRIGDGEWGHASLVAAGVTDPVVSTFTVAPDGVGAMLYRGQEGTGDVSHEGVSLVWDYAADGVADAARVTVEVFAVEMVYVPERDYYLGSNGGADGEFYKVVLYGNNRFQVTSEARINVGIILGNLNYDVLLGGAELAGNIPAAFPKGHDAFYCMKYEVSQQQYASFYNSATAAQQSALVLAGMDTRVPETTYTRNGLAFQPDGTLGTSAPDVPVNWISPLQILAFLDWSGLRPMTELEFEKACRGHLSPNPNEYAWGSSTACSVPFTIMDGFSESELVAGLDSDDAEVGAGVYAGNSPADGPLRSGIFAASFPTRKGSGGSYYGIMELSGNLSEYAVTAGDNTGRDYTGLHGDGTLSATGTADVTAWPTAEDGYGTRGGDFSRGASAMQVSSRESATESFSASAGIGFRGVRSDFTN